MLGAIVPPFLLAANPTAWLTPIWLIGAGCIGGLLVLAALYGLAKLVAPTVADVAQGTLRESFVLPFLCLAGGFAAFALLSVVLSLAGVGYLPWDDITRSLERLPLSNSFQTQFTVPVAKADQADKPQEFPLDCRPQEIRSIEIHSDQDLEFYPRDPGMMYVGMIPKKITLNKNETWSWPSKSSDENRDAINPFAGRRATLYVLSPTERPAQIAVSGTTREEYPQVAVVPYTAAGVAGLVILYMLMRLLIPKIMAVASATAKEAINEPVFQVVLALGSFALVAFVFIPYNTFGEDVKMLKMCALDLIMFLSIIVAAWTASVSIAEEIEGRTALTVLSKPVGRIQFIVGKFLGVVQSVSLLYLFLGVILLVVVCGKVVYDVRESSAPEALWPDCFAEMSGIVPGLVLAFFETIVITSISVAISTRLSMIPNLLISLSVYALGNLAPLLVQSKVADPYGIVHFVGELLATVLPVLENFNLHSAIAAGQDVPLVYLKWALLYCFLYSSVAMLLALILFEDRDLA
ncbi:MAG TPA: ABC transporter permease [Pirellulales bacterium]|jgi:ABC-type transport system involved in multi-copper enzyme maturation permease subunit|nr:ABC transporter permease [Pirellulales bacterium]